MLLRIADRVDKPVLLPGVKNPDAPIKGPANPQFGAQVQSGEAWFAPQTLFKVG
jgi:hypothetical protein